jgi:hypothetical protein
MPILESIKKYMPEPDEEVRQARIAAEEARKHRESLAAQRLGGLELMASESGIARPNDSHKAANIAADTDEHPILVRPKAKR